MKFLALFMCLKIGDTETFTRNMNSNTSQTVCDCQVYFDYYSIFSPLSAGYISLAMVKRSSHVSDMILTRGSSSG